MQPDLLGDDAGRQTFMPLFDKQAKDREAMLVSEGAQGFRPPNEQGPQGFRLKPLEKKLNITDRPVENQKALGEIGRIVAARVVQRADDLTIITSNGVAIRIKNKDVKQAGRSTKGVHLIKPQPGDSVASVARIAAQDLKKAGAETEEEKPEPQPQLI